MAGPLLLDTDILIDYLRGQVKAVAFLKKTRRHLLVSALTVAELHVGVREGSERQVLDDFLGLMEVVAVTPEIARLGGLWRRDHGKSHGTGLIDALIAATAEISGCTLATLNEKHFPMLEGVLVPYRKT
ncbi:MAG: type II toxin-antitoxin system VapC family toxin [Sulfuritalea sp.]|jgi:predicted nucleic acid-binding protein|nr:type II toxin-antitoxin system VapC family toxin [Sulfuritalea sp.]MBK8761441.1 type II toxin-antitoxin system VapC family toxin [Sulfuritalea sp.]